MLVKSNILRSPHAFSTRNGGVSRLAHTSCLNLAFGRGDDDETVLENLEIFAKKAGFDPKSIVSLPQIHSDVIFTVSQDDRGKGYFIRDGIAEGDGYVTCEHGVTLGIKTADCVPILLEAERDGKVVAVGAVHAGWRGTVSGIAPKCVERLIQEFGVGADKIRAAIGPCIHGCCYEVSADVLDAAKDRVGQDLASQYIVPRENVEGKYTCDLAGLNKGLLINAGLLPENVEIIDECTCCNPEKYFSHRFSGGVRGTMLSVIFIE